MINNAGRVLRSAIKKSIFFVNYPIQKYLKSGDVFITCTGNHDGAGAQVHAVISTILFAKLYNLKYVHTPFLDIEHNKTNSKAWAAQWETFFSLGYQEIDIDRAKGFVNETVSLKHPLILWKKKKVLYTVRNCHECTDLFVSQYNQLRPGLRYKFSTNKSSKDEIESKNRGLQIALHIRRGDVKNTGLTKDRYTDFKEITIIVDDITEFCRSNNLQFQVHIYSQGTPDAYQIFQQYNSVLHLNEDEFVTFSALVKADILVMAKSSFSYVAALLSDGLIFYDDFWHPPLEGWVSFKKTNSATRHRCLENYFIKQ